MYFQELNIECDIEFQNCNFRKALEFSNVTTNKTEVFQQKIKGNLSITNSKVDLLSFRKECKIKIDIYLNGKTEIKNFRIIENFETEQNIIISDCTINNSFLISQAKSNSIIITQNSNINCLLKLENLNSDSIILKKSNFIHDISFWKCKTQKIILNHSFFNKTVEINAVSVTDRLTIEDSEFKDSIIIRRRSLENNVCDIFELYVSATKFGNQFKINGENAKIEKLRIESSKKLEGTLNFSHLNILKTEVSGDITNCNLIFTNCNYNNLKFNSCYNYSTVSLSSINSFSSNSSINIKNSNLGKTHLFNVNFNSFDYININNSFLIDIIFVNVQWFSDYKLNSDKKVELNFFDQKREIYRQLKYALDKQGDRITALKFKAMEMEAYKKHTFVNKKKYSRIFNNDRFILWLGQVNDYGLNWIKPTGLAIAFSLAFHFIITISVSDSLSFKPNINEDSLITTLDTYFANLNTLPQLMNPVHNLRHIYPKMELSFTVYFFDYLLKLILAFLIFQIISAFRKYIK